MFYCITEFYAEVGKQIFFFQSANRKSANCWARSVIANPQISLVCQSANPQIFLINPLIANPRISTKHCLATVLKVVFVNVSNGR